MYPDYKRFDIEKLEKVSLPTSLRQKYTYNAFGNLYLHALDKIALIKQKYVKGNYSPFMNNYIHRALIARTRLRNRFLKEATAINRLIYKNQRDYFFSLMRTNIKQYYVDLNVSCNVNCISHQ